MTILPVKIFMLLGEILPIKIVTIVMFLGEILSKRLKPQEKFKTDSSLALDR